MSAVDPSKLAILQELNSRRGSLAPDKLAILDELSSRLSVPVPPNAQTPTHAFMPQDAGIRARLSIPEHLINFGRDVVNELPNIGTIAGGMVGNIPGAGVGAMAGETAKNLIHAAGVGPEPPPSTALGELKDVGGAGIKGAGEQAVAGMIHSGATAAFEPVVRLLPRAPVHPSVKDFADAVKQNGNIHVEDTFRNAVNNAMPYLKKAERKFNTKVLDIRDARDIAMEASKDAWKPYQTLLDSTRSKITRDEILANAESQLPAGFRDSNYSAYKRITNKWAEDLAKPEYTAQEIEDEAQRSNVRLKSLYAKDNLDRAAAEKMPEYAGDEAILKARRTLLDTRIKADTGYDPVQLRKDYGYIRAVHNSLLKSPSADDTLYENFTRNIPTTKAEASGKLLARITRSNPDQLVRRAFKNYTAPPEPMSLVHAGWETPTVPESEPSPPIGMGLETPQPPSKFLNAQTARANPVPPTRTARPMPPIPPKQLGTGQRMLPAAGDTSVKTPPMPPESFTEALERQDTPQSRRMREIVGKGPFNTQSRPATAEEYLRTKGGRQMPKKPEAKP